MERRDDPRRVAARDDELARDRSWRRAWSIPRLDPATGGLRAKYGFKKDITLEVVDGMTGLSERDALARAPDLRRARGEWRTAPESSRGDHVIREAERAVREVLLMAWEEFERDGTGGFTGDRPLDELAAALKAMGRAYDDCSASSSMRLLSRSNSGSQLSNARGLFTRAAERNRRNERVARFNANRNRPRRDHTLHFPPTEVMVDSEHQASSTMMIICSRGIRNRDPASDPGLTR